MVAIFPCYSSDWLNHRGRWKHGWNSLTRCVVARDNGSSIGELWREGGKLARGCERFCEDRIEYVIFWNLKLESIILYSWYIFRKNFKQKQRIDGKFKIRGNKKEENLIYNYLIIICFYIQFYVKIRNEKYWFWGFLKIICF